jgi:hypothetical protein
LTARPNVDTVKDIVKQDEDELVQSRKRSKDQNLVKPIAVKQSTKDQNFVKLITMKKVHSIANDEQAAVEKGQGAKNWD